MLELNIRDFGAIGDGKSIDSNAINNAIIVASDSGGGKIILDGGKYLCFSIRLRSNIAIEFRNGAKIIAANPAYHSGNYDLPENNPHDYYQDFGHSHWHNSLIYGVDIENISITGQGIIDGIGLTREGPGPKWQKRGEFPISMKGLSKEIMDELVPERSAMNGLGNKAIALKNVRNINLDSFTILNGGHFAILLTGCENVNIDSLLIDTNRDGIDIDASKNIHIANCKVNSPNDDAIVLKSSLALGYIKATENVNIENSIVSGFDVGSVYNQTFTRNQEFAPDRDRVTGRIKIGTETNGDFKNISVKNCHFNHSRGIAIESVDGGNIENIVFDNIKMENITTAPIFIRLGSRLRAPEGVKTGSIKNIKLKNIKAINILPNYCAQIIGVKNGDISNISLENISLEYVTDANLECANINTDEMDTTYPEPSMFGITPASGIWVKYADNIHLKNMTIKTTGNRPEKIYESANVIEE